MPAAGAKAIFILNRLAALGAKPLCGLRFAFRPIPCSCACLPSAFPSAAFLPSALSRLHRFHRFHRFHGLHRLHGFHRFDRLMMLLFRFLELQLFRFFQIRFAAHGLDLTTANSNVFRSAFTLNAENEVAAITEKLRRFGSICQYEKQCSGFAAGLHHRCSRRRWCHRLHFAR